MSGALALPAAPASLTHADAAAYVARCEQAIASGGAGAHCELDASALEDFDSAALAALLAVRRRALAVKGTLRVHGLPERLQSLATLYGVSDLLPA